MVLINRLHQVQGLGFRSRLLTASVQGLWFGIQEQMVLINQPPPPVAAPFYVARSTHAHGGRGGEREEQKKTNRGSRVCLECLQLCFVLLGMQNNNKTLNRLFGHFLSYLFIDSAETTSNFPCRRRQTRRYSRCNTVGPLRRQTLAYSPCYTRGNIHRSQQHSCRKDRLLWRRQSLRC